MRVTEEFIASIQDEHGLTKGQQYLLSYWLDLSKKMHYVGYEHIPDQAANYLMLCKGYRAMPQRLRDWRLGL